MSTLPSIQKLFVAAAVVAGVGCGGQTADSFANATYVQITGSDSLQPAATAAPNGVRIVFLNNDGIPHTINWDSPLQLTATAPAGGRAWFELPTLIQGTVASYHLDSNGPTGSVTIISAQ